ncbi:MAG: hypothetical protein ACI4QT_05300 [Kiritimatiellia bacterium]
MKNPDEKQCASEKPHFRADLLRTGKSIGDTLVQLFAKTLGHNGGLKTVSFLLALLIILGVHKSFGEKKDYRVPLHIQNQNNKTVIVSTSPKTVRIWLRGSKDEIDRFDETALSLEQNFSPVPNCASEGCSHIDTVKLSPKSIKGLGNLRVDSIIPEEISVTYEHMAKLVTTNIVTIPVLRGKPLQATASVSLPDPLVVTFFGPYSKLSDFSKKGLSIPTSEIDVDGKTESFTQPVRLIIPSDSGILSADPSIVTASVTIKNHKPVNPKSISLPEYIPAEAPAPSGGTNAETNVMEKTSATAATQPAGEENESASAKPVAESPANGNSPHIPPVFP